VESATARSFSKTGFNEPEILLLDEPFSHIDNFRKMRYDAICSYLKTKESLVLATLIQMPCLMIKRLLGTLIDKGDSFHLYNNPINK
jgi:ABC-type phosphate transport system ATPase subunit